MGYFANGSEGEQYDLDFCTHCVHMHPDHGCPCWTAHMLWNYNESNRPDSILHKMIPREGVFNGACIFFVKKEATDGQANPSD